MNTFPYSAPCERELTTTEKSILSKLLEQDAPERLPEIERLKVRARCGCGMCPTIIFTEAVEPTKSDRVLVSDFLGQTTAGQLVGVMLWADCGELSELEAWSVEGDEVREWPTLESLKHFDEKLGKRPRGFQ